MIAGQHLSGAPVCVCVLTHAPATTACTRTGTYALDADTYAHTYVATQTILNTQAHILTHNTTTLVHLPYLP